MMSTQTISEAQLEVFRTMTDSDGTTLNNNYRPPQPLNARTIYTTGTSTTASSNMITDLLNTAFTAAVVTGLVGIVAPLFSPPPTQQRSSDAASARAEQSLRAGRDQWGSYWG